MEIIVASTDLGVLFKSADKILKKYNSGSEVPENIKGQSALSVLKKLFAEDYFSIMSVDRLVSLHNVEISSEHYKWMHTLHCVHFSDMHPETREYLFALCVEYFKPILSMTYVDIR